MWQPFEETQTQSIPTSVTPEHVDLLTSSGVIKALTGSLPVLIKFFKCVLAQKKSIYNCCESFTTTKLLLAVVLG